MAVVRLTADELGLLNDVIARRAPELGEAVTLISSSGAVTMTQALQLREALGDELEQSGVDLPSGDLNELGGRLGSLHDRLLVVPTTDEIVDAYWTYFHLSQGDKRKRAAADDYFWGWEEVASMVDEGRIEDTLKLLDALLQSPSADPCVVGAGPLENLLSNRRDESQKQVDERVRQEPAWREAMECAHP